MVDPVQQKLIDRVRRLTKLFTEEPTEERLQSLKDAKMRLAECVVSSFIARSEGLLPAPVDDGERVERVARAIYEAEPCGNWDLLNVRGLERWKKLARAALAAINGDK